MTRQSHAVSINSKLQIFSSWWNDNKGWFTSEQLAKIIGCQSSSLRPAFSWLRRNGYVVTSKWVFISGCNLYNIKKGNVKELQRDASRSRTVINKVSKQFVEALEQPTIHFARSCTPYFTK